MKPFKRIVILTGAGISAESGLGTFRDVNGLWTKYDLSDVATPEGFARNPILVHEFYNARRRNLQSAAPNNAHLALAQLERDHSAQVLLVTQNVDDLHERAGSQNLTHMHGELFKVRCENCNGMQIWREDLSLDHVCPGCGQLGKLRPHVVWFGEMPFEMDRIGAALAQCDLFVSIGTSGTVYPAAGFVREVRGYGQAHTVEVNLEPSDGASLFKEQIYGPATEIVPQFVEHLLKG